MYRSFIDALYKGDTLSDICRTSADICQHYGFDHFSYSTRIPVSLVTPRYLVIESVEDQPAGSIDSCQADSFRQYILTASPSYWQEDDTESRKGLVARILNESSVSGSDRPKGLTIPIHARHSGAAMMNFSLHDRHRQSQDEVNETLPEIYLLATHTHEVISRFVRFEDYELKVNKISNREKECLKWSTEGITTAEIANKLNITESTVTFHLQNVMRKLSASNRQQAIARAIMLGVI